MKKLLLIAANIVIAASSNAQRLALYEEFTGENCPPCAATNPGFDALAITAANASKVLVIKYQVPIPSAGTILYPQAKVYADARDAYYSISSAPSGMHDGVTPSTGSHPGSFTQAAIDAQAAVASPFKITVTATWDATYTNINAKIDVEATSAYTGSGSVYLRTALVQDVNFCTAPGTNGEKDFSHVVRSMYPDATGTSVASSWTAGTKQTYNFTIPVPNYVDKSADPFIAVWVQADGDKKIAQAARSASLPDVASDLGNGSCPSSSIACISGTTGNVTHSLNIKNFGTTTATTADIYYKLGTGAYAKYTWSGSLASGASTSVTLPAVTTGAGNAVFTDSIVFAGDKNQGNNVTKTTIAVASTAPNALPIANNFESGVPSGWIYYDSDKSGNLWVNGDFTGASGAPKSGKFAGWYKTYAYSKGSSSMIIIPTPTVAGSVALDFWEAYAQANASNNDKLEVLYSTNCGTSWTSFWSATGAAHATHAPVAVGATYWLPASSTSADWVKRSINISSLPANSLLAIKATADGGNMLLIDDINIRSGLNITEKGAALSAFSISPNPATDYANLTFNLNESTNVQVTVVDALGKTVLTVADENMTSGSHDIRVNTASLASGMYLIKVATNEGTITERISVAK